MRKRRTALTMSIRRGAQHDARAAAAVRPAGADGGRAVSAREPRRGFRDWLGGILSQWADRLIYGDGHDITIRDGDGNWICTISVPGGYVAAGPTGPYTFECCEAEL